MLFEPILTCAQLKKAIRPPVVPSDLHHRFLLRIAIIQPRVPHQSEKWMGKTRSAVVLIWCPAGEMDTHSSSGRYFFRCAPFLFGPRLFVYQSWAQLIAPSENSPRMYRLKYTHRKSFAPIHNLIKHRFIFQKIYLFFFRGKN